MPWHFWCALRDPTAAVEQGLWSQAANEGTQAPEVATMRALPVLVIGLTLAKLAVFVAISSLIRLSPADPGPLEVPDE